MAQEEEEEGGGRGRELRTDAPASGVEAGAVRLAGGREDGAAVVAAAVAAVGDGA